MDKNRKTLVIMRVSTTRQDFAVQRSSLERLVERHKVTPIPLEKYLQLKKDGFPVTNMAISIEDKGSGKSVNRPGYQFALNEIRQGHVGKVLCYDLTRLDRNINNALAFADACLEHDVEIDTCQGLIDLKSKDGKLKYDILAAIAEYNRRTISENATASWEAFVKEEAKKPEGERRKWGGGTVGRMSDRLKRDWAYVLELHDNGATLNHIRRMTKLNCRTIRFLIAKRDNPELTYRAFGGRK